MSRLLKNQDIIEAISFAENANADNVAVNNNISTDKDNENNRIKIKKR